MLLVRVFILVGVMPSLAFADALQDELDALHTEIVQHEGAVGEGELKYLELVKEYNKPEQVGRIYAGLADMFFDLGSADTDSVKKYARLALTYPLDPLISMKMYLILGEVLGRHDEGRNMPAGALTNSTIAYMKGLRVGIDQKLPDDLREPLKTFALRGSGPDYERLQRENEERREARREWSRIKELLDMRDTLERRLFFSYCETERSERELKELAIQYLADEFATTRLLARFKKAKDELAGIAIEGPSVLYPHAPADFRERMGLGPVLESTKSEVVRQKE